MSYLLSSKVFTHKLHPTMRNTVGELCLLYNMKLFNTSQITLARRNKSAINFSYLKNNYKKYRSFPPPWTCQKRSLSCSQCLSNLNTSNPSEELKNRKELTIPEKIVGSFPSFSQPYLRLSRMHRPIGTWLLFWPCTWGLALGAEGLPSLAILSLFGVGAFIMRGAGCTINDMWDRHIDAKVKRTIDRPLACGQLRMRHAAAWLACQLSIAFVILCQLNAPCFILGVGSLGLVILYPLAKRVTHWPQAVLGLTFNTGVIMGYTSTQSSNLGYLAVPWIDPACIALYLSGLSWTLIYDTIYAHQDKEDDALLGLGSTARKFGDNTKYWLSGFSLSMISSLTAAGIVSDQCWPYYVGVAATASHLVWQITTLDINNHQSCADRFTSNRHIGWLILLSLLGSYYVKTTDHSQKEKSEKTNNERGND